MRFKVRVREVRQTREFDQMVFIDLEPTATSDATWTATIGMSPQQPTYYRSDAGGPWSKDVLRVSGGYLLR